MRKTVERGVNFIGKRLVYTNRFAEQIVQQVRPSDRHNVGLNHELTDEDVWPVVQYIVDNANYPST